MRNLNPLGIRKLDVQKQRREWERELSPIEAERILGAHLLNCDQQMMRMAIHALCKGWEEGVKVGAQATRERVAESLANGKLVKP